MQELNHTFFSVLRLAKIFFDSDVPDKAKNDIGIWELDEDSCYALGLEASEWIFQNTAHYYNERNDVDTWLFSDPIIDRFCRLCQEYERDKGITEEENPYRSTIEQTIRENFRFDSYSYGYQERCDYLIQSGSQSPAVMDRWVLKVQGLEEKKKHYEQVLQRELDGLDDEFGTLKFLAQELQVRANSIRFQKVA